MILIRRRRRVGAGVFLLISEDEWYKAAYYKPVDNESYSLYANGSDSAASLEQNGTFDMMGNVWEWNESAFDSSTNNMAASRVFRGGSVGFNEADLRSSNRNSFSPAFEDFSIGFFTVARLFVDAASCRVGIGLVG